MTQDNAPPVIMPEISEYYSRRIRILIQQFPGMPVFITQILKELNSENTNIEQISEKIRIDPGITTNLLRLANSARYGSISDIKSIKEAIVRLGIKRTLEILVTFHVAGHLTAKLRGYELASSELFIHSIWTALAAEGICQQIKFPNTDHVFTAALLHDLGKVLLSDFVFQEQEQILGLVQKHGYSFDEAEKSVLGWNHADVGGAILQHWHFPEMLIQAARYHHSPDLADEKYKRIDCIIHLADCLAYCQGTGAGIDGFSYHNVKKATAIIPLTKTEIERIAAQSLEKVNVLRESFNI